MAYETVEFASEQLALSDQSLAVAALTRQIAAAEAEVSSAERYRRFVGTYDPVAPGPRPHPEAGGSDHSDWELARAEYDQYDPGQEGEDAMGDVSVAELELSCLLELKGHVDNGDEETIWDIAGEERRRLLNVIAESRQSSAS